MVDGEIILTCLLRPPMDPGTTTTQHRPVRAFEVEDGDPDLEMDDVPLFSGYYQDLWMLAMLPVSYGLCIEVLLGNWEG